MRLWRLSSSRRSRNLDGGYGLFNDGRWNTRGRPVTYCCTVPSLAALEKRVHVSDPVLLPPQVLVAYELPDNISRRIVGTAELPLDWPIRDTYTQGIGDRWLDSITETLLFVPSVIVPSVIVPIVNVPDLNVLINHRAPEASSIRIADVVAFTLDPRLFRP
jgi:RES domain-containing protein